MTIPKWTEERTEQLTNFVGDESPVSQATVAEAAEALETSSRSVAGKLRKMGADVAKAGEATKTFSDDEAETLRAFVEGNEGQFTYADIAENFAGGKFSAKQVQGKILSMELTGAVKPTPKKEVEKKYSDAEAATVAAMCNAGDFVEDIAAAVGKTVPSVRGKALALLRAKEIDGMPKQRDVKGKAIDPLTEMGDVSDLTVEAIAEKLGKTTRGVKTMLTRRGLVASDHDGAARKAKASA